MCDDHAEWETVFDSAVVVATLAWDATSTGKAEDRIRVIDTIRVILRRLDRHLGGMYP
jgi:hypothetical protein